jgi:hypothetical protein
MRGRRARIAHLRADRDGLVRHVDTGARRQRALTRFHLPI